MWTLQKVADFEYLSVFQSAVSRVGPIFSPVATHEASGVVGDAGFFSSVFLKQASLPPLLSTFTTADFRAWLLEFRSFLTRFHLQTFLDRAAPSSSAIPDQGAAIVWFLIQQALKPAMSQPTASGRVLHLMLTVLHRRATPPPPPRHFTSWRLIWISWSSRWPPSLRCLQSR